MTKSILIIDDERAQADALSRKLKAHYPEAETMVASTEDEIEFAINNKFYNLVFLDIRMDDYTKNGIDYAKEIIEYNPFAKILFVSRFLSEYVDLINPLMGSGRILGFSDKKEYDLWMTELTPIIDTYYQALSSDSTELQATLQNFYAKAKNESDTYQKGLLFENFVTLLFGSIGYKDIIKRVKDGSSNEVDLIIRNEIDDSFMRNFGQYFLVECKNHPDKNVGKNDFIIFKKKLDNTAGLSHIGFLFSTSAIARTAYREALRESQGVNKVFFVDHAKIESLLSASDMLSELKRIIDDQVKDN